MGEASAVATEVSVESRTRSKNALFIFILKIIGHPMGGRMLQGFASFRKRHRLPALIKAITGIER
jgi:hypothetical protein